MIFEHVENDDAKLARLIELGNGLWSQRPDLQDNFPKDDPTAERRYWYWLAWFGTQPEFCHRASEIEEVMPPLPPDHLAGRVFGEESTRRAFLTSGLVNWRRFLDCFEGAGGQLDPGLAILDFGAGCGRIARHFRYDIAARGLDFQACDVDAEAMTWVQDELSPKSTYAVPHLPPTQLPEAHFDLVYAYSVFSHLTEEASRMWLTEIHRAMKPGGMAILTTMGLTCGEAILADSRSHPFPPRKILKKQWKLYENDGFLFFPYGEVHSNLEENSEFFGQWDLDAYGCTFVSPDYIHRHWSDHFEILALHEGPDQWQDFPILRKR